MIPKRKKKCKYCGYSEKSLMHWAKCSKIPRKRQRPTFLAQIIEENRHLFNG